MVYTEIKTIKGRQYKYLRKCVRINGRVVHRTVKYLGPLKPRYRSQKKKAIRSDTYNGFESESSPHSWVG
jgi:hypothetical protein